MRRRKRRFRNCWIAIRASPGGASARYASRGMVSGRGSHRPEKQPDPGVGANRQPTGRAKGSRLRFGLCVWCGLPCGGQSLPRRRPGAAALIMPICNTVAMNHHLGEISGQVAAPRFREGRLCPCRGDPRSCRLAPQPGSRGARQYHFAGAAAVQPGAQSGRADWALSAQHWLANSVFINLADLMDACEMAWNRFAANHGLIRSLCAVAWVPALPARYVAPAMWPQIEGTLVSRNLRRSV